MVEPPAVGFTGVIWEARPTEQLARDLSTGPGAKPMADASAAWARLGASFGAAALEYDQIVARIRQSWSSDESEAVIERIARLRDWLGEAAAQAGRNATHAGSQAVAYEVAALAMPHVDDVAALENAKRGVEQAGAALGAPMVAAAAELDSEQGIAKANAARVMQSYESATAPLAMPWEHPSPPMIASGVALEAEQAAAQSSSQTSGPSPAPSTVAPAGAFAGTGAAMPRAKTAYHAPTVAQSTTAQERVPVQQSVPTSNDSGAGRMAPGMMPRGAGMVDEAERSGRAGAAAAAAAAAAAGADDALGIEAGTSAAPPVLGAPDTARGEAESTGESG